MVTLMLGALLLLTVGLPATGRADGCGELGQPCCGTTCSNPGLVCNGGTCDTILCWTCLCYASYAVPEFCSNTPLTLADCSACPSSLNGPEIYTESVRCTDIGFCA